MKTPQTGIIIHVHHYKIVILIISNSESIDFKSGAKLT